MRKNKEKSMIKTNYKFLYSNPPNYKFGETGYDAPSGVVLNAANRDTKLPTQMSKDWCFEFVPNKLAGTNIAEKIKLSERLEDSKNIVSRYVFAIDKSDGAGYFTKLSNNF